MHVSTKNWISSSQKQNDREKKAHHLTAYTGSSWCPGWSQRPTCLSARSLSLDFVCHLLRTRIHEYRFSEDFCKSAWYSAAAGQHAEATQQSSHLNDQLHSQCWHASPAPGRGLAPGSHLPGPCSRCPPEAYGAKPHCSWVKNSSRLKDRNAKGREYQHWSVTQERVTFWDRILNSTWSCGGRSYQ